MPAKRFKKLYPRVRLTGARRPKAVADRLLKLESEISDLRSVIRELIETLEFELARDLDRDQRIGKVSRRGLPKTVRLGPSTPPSRIAARPAPLSANIP